MTRTTSFDLQFTQIAWVVKDIKAAERIFRETMGITNFSKAEIIRSNEFNGTHYGEPSDAESLVTIAYTGETYIQTNFTHYKMSVLKCLPEN